MFQRLSSLLRHRRLARELREELESHRSMVQERLERSGMSPAEAARESRRTLGNVTLAQEEAREQWIWPSLERFWQDVRFGARMLIKQPTFSVTAIATLAIGIGATTTMAGVASGELWRPMPFPDVDRLVSIFAYPAGAPTWDQIAPDEFDRWQRDARSFDGLAATGPSARRALRGRNVPESIRTQAVTSNFFTVLGWSPARGRGFVPSDDDAAVTGEGRVAVLTDSAWRRFFNADPAIVGKTIAVDEHAIEIVGVLGAGQRLEFSQEPELYTLIRTRPSAADPAAAARRMLGPVGRLAAGVTIRAAEDELRAIEARAISRTPNRASPAIAVDRLDADSGYNWRTLYFFLGAALFVLALSAANVVNLLLARTLDRQREFAIRSALGGGRAAIARQLMMEGLWVAVPGTLAGVLAAAWAAQLLSSLIPSGYLQRSGEVALDGRAALFALAACTLATLAFGALPLLLNRVNLNAVLTRTNRGIAGSPGQHRARRVLVVVEVVIAFVLVFGAGLFFNSYLRLRSMPIGFDPVDRLAMGLSLSGQRYASPDSILAFAHRLIEEVRAVPGVSSAAVGSSLPLGSGTSMWYFRTDQPVPQLKDAPADGPRGPARAVSPDYFHTLGMNIVSGRAFTAADASGASRVAIINQTLAARLFAEADPIGREILARPRGSSWLKETRVVIVGVVQNSKDVGMHEVSMSTIYLPLAQQPAAVLQLVAHTSVPATSVVDPIRRAVAKVDNALPTVNVTTMTDRVNNALRSNRFNLALLGAFAGIALVLAAIGLYGSMAYATQQRVPELALRHALGARIGELLALVVRQALALGVLGVAIGVAAAFVVARLIGDALYLVERQHEGLIYGVTTTDPPTLIAAAVIVAAIVVAAGALPARRALGIDPATVLRNE